MSSLTTPHRRLLESAVKHARKIATGGARKSLEALAVHEPDPYPHMDEAQRTLRRKLRAQARQLGDGESHTKRGSYEITHLVEKLAYDQWHRILFARYLLENKLLISPLHSTSGNPVDVSLDDCEELAPSQGLKDAWAVAARFAAAELPEIFRADDPAGAVELPVEDRNPLIALVTDLPMDVFTAGDSLGWCYQFWQSDQKETVNKSGNKIGADELPSVTQLFTEDYMVDFLLDNTLGAWWAGKRMKDEGGRMKFATEEEARQFCALPGCPWKYLRFIKVPPDGEAAAPTSSFIPHPSSFLWTPAAGTFEGWPKTAAELKCLDPCMGSGHFVVAMFERLVALRLAEEKLDEAAAVAAVIRDNLFGLEIDPRCTQIGAFNLALAAWRRVGHCKLPAMNLACSGLAPNTRVADWLEMAGDNPRLKFGMQTLYRLFEKAPVLGSLINPNTATGAGFSFEFHELQPLLEKALAKEAEAHDLSAEALAKEEMAVTARGLAKAAEILAGQFTLVATNVPYLGRGKQDEVLMDYCERVHPEAKADLATCFVERCIDFNTRGGSIALVTPQNWLFQSGFQKLRVRLLSESEWSGVAKLGTKAFQGIGGEVVTVALAVLCREQPRVDHCLFGLDVGSSSTPDTKAEALASELPRMVGQKDQHNNPEARIGFDVREAGASQLGDYCECYQGVVTGDISRWVIRFWEADKLDSRLWSPCRAPSDGNSPFDGQHDIIRWEQGKGQLHDYAALTRDQLHDMHESGNLAWGRRGVVINRVKTLRAGLYYGEIYHNSVAAIVPKDQALIKKVWAFCNSPSFEEEVRRLSPALGVTNRVLIQIPFNPDDWEGELPKPFSSDPTQWLFNGHPAGADQPLHVAVARLLGYQWPRQTGSSFPDCPALGPDGLETLADDDGIVCLSATKGEAPAAERLRALLAQAMGKLDLPALIASAGPGGKKGSKSESLEDWLRDEFFEQHCALFDNRPFIWHLWDGHKSGFSALVNYHHLTHATLENLTYAYLGDWIRRQQAAVEAEEAGSDAKLQAAKLLQTRLKLILEGEPPYDLFVRWKPLSKQAIGWHPDLNDGVRMNIRPFLATDIPGGKKGAGLLRTKPNIKWEKDRGKEPQRDKAEFPWFWKGSAFTGDRVNDVNLTKEQKEKARLS